MIKERQSKRTGRREIQRLPETQGILRKTTVGANGNYLFDSQATSSVNGS